MSMKCFAPCKRTTALLLAALMIGCGGTESNTPGRAEPAPEPAADTSGAAIEPDERGTQGRADGASGSAAPGASAPAASTAGQAQSSENGSLRPANGTVLFIGTSLTAGQGVAEAQSFPLLIERRIEEAGLPFDVVNAGVSGETSAGALRRIDWLLRQDFDVAVIETGANDMLRGVAPEATESNIQAIVDRISAARPDARIVLAGMLSLPNMGAAYAREFEAIYPRVAQRNDLPFVPFLLEGVGGEQELNQDDGVHPNAAGHRIIAETVWNVLEPVLVETADEQDPPGDPGA